MQDRLVSVIVPVYNVEKYLPKCIESITGQTYKCLELVLVDDGSTDNSGNICDGYASADGRVRVLHRENGGRAAARNTGIEAASGDYLMFVDGDDWIDANTLEELICIMDENTEMVIFRGRNIYSDRVEDESTGEVRRFMGAEPLEFYIEGYKDFQVLNAVWGKLYKSSLLKDIRFEEGRYYEDVMVTTRAYAACRDSIYLDRAFYNYSIATENSITYQWVTEFTFQDEIPVFFEKEQFLKEIGRDDLAEKYACFLYQRLILYYNVTVRKREQSYAKRLRDIVQKDKRKIRRLLKQDYVSSYIKMYMHAFLLHPRLANMVEGAAAWLHKRKKGRKREV